MKAHVWRSEGGKYHVLGYECSTAAGQYLSFKLKTVNKHDIRYQCLNCLKTGAKPIFAIKVRGGG